MVKFFCAQKFWVSIFFFLLLGLKTKANTVNGTPSPNSTTSELTCNAPAPDSFRVVARSNQQFTLKWNPVTSNSLHTLMVYSRPDSLTPWSTVQKVKNLAGNSFVFSNAFEEADYFLELSTNCDINDPSSVTVELLLPKVIIQVDAPGIKPNEITPVSGYNINFFDHEWVGFEVKKIEGEVWESNFFQVTYQGSERDAMFLIRNVVSGSTISTLNIDGFPPPPRSDAPNPVEIVNFNDPFVPKFIGKTKIDYRLERGVFVDIYRDFFDSNWDINYSFQVYVNSYADFEVLDTPLEGHSEGNSEILVSNELEVQNPFFERLSILLPCTQEPHEVEIQIFDQGGRRYYEKKIKTIEPQIIIDTHEFASGFYFAQIRNNFDALVFKLFKPY